MKKTFLSICYMLVLGLGVAVMTMPNAVAQDKKSEKKLSDRTVRVIMGTAFAGVPEELPDATGKMVKIDRSDPKKFMIPLDDAREIIIKAVLSARADLCGLGDLYREHSKRILLHERARNKWTPYQMTYIDILHATTGLYMTGSFAAGEEAKKDDNPADDRRKDYDCSQDERERVKEAVEADIQKLAQVQ